MEPLVTPEAMAAADRRTITGGVSEATLVARAGDAVAWQVRRRLRGTYGRRAVVVCGPGNNGADGKVAARTLERWGLRASVFELADGIDERAFTRALDRADVAVDAMYGTGLRRDVDGDAAAVVSRLDHWSGPVVAVDIPSGVDGLIGAVRGVAVRAAATVTFAARKPGLVLEPGRSHAGAVVVAEIGIDLGPDGGASPPLSRLDASDVRALLPPRAPDAHKWLSAVMVVGGSGGMTGAPTFASVAAMRAGAGIVWCELPGVDTARRAAGGEVIARALPAADDGGLAASAPSEILGSIGRFRALALGPGLGRGDGTVAAVRELVAEVPVPLVLDADGLNALAGDTGLLAARGDRGRTTVVTPHDGEYRRLAGCDAGPDRVSAAVALAGRARAVVLLKGPGTVVASPEGRAVVNATGSEALATAGTGDVLTGIVAGFLARGAAPFDAAAAAAWVHGAAADRARTRTGASGMVASDLLGEIAPTLLALDENGSPGYG
jgi:NAD(P)H-hydrate epimerase